MTNKANNTLLYHDFGIGVISSSTATLLVYLFSSVNIMTSIFIGLSMLSATAGYIIGRKRPYNSFAHEDCGVDDDVIFGKETSDELEMIANIVVGKCQVDPRISSMISEAFSPNRDTRRDIHVKILHSPKNVRDQFIICMKELVNSDNPRIRGEAYYCIGELNIDNTIIVDESFFADGLKDNHLFVKACCSNILKHYIPLSNKTKEILRTELSLCNSSKHRGKNSLKLSYYISRTLLENEQHG